MNADCNDILSTLFDAIYEFAKYFVSVMTEMYFTLITSSVTRLPQCVSLDKNFSAYAVENYTWSLIVVLRIPL